MPEEHTSEKLFSSGTGLAGAFFGYQIITILNKVSINCVSYVEVTLNLMLMFSILLIMLPITQLVCITQCTDCDKSTAQYMNLTIVMLTIITILGIITSIGLSKKGKCYNKDARDSMLTLSGVSGGLLLLAVGWKFYFREKKGIVN